MESTSQKLQEALEYATKMHGGQTRKGDGRPYVLHPISVLITLGNVKKSKNKFLLAIACLCHDLVEDCDVTLHDISERFGLHVAALVAELTSDKGLITEMGKEAYLIQKMIKMSSYGLCIKLADRYDNISDNPTSNTIEQTKRIIKVVEASRKLTKTHKTLIKMIKKEIKVQEKKLSKIISV